MNTPTPNAPVNASEAELKKFGDLANRWWGETACSRESGGLLHVAERRATEGPAGAMRLERFGANR